MSALDDFNQFVADAQAAVYYAKWSSQNTGLASKWRAFRDALVRGDRPAPPDMGANAYGRALIDVGRMYLNATAEQPTPPPPSGNPVPAPASGVYFGAYINGNPTYPGATDNAPYDAAVWDTFEQHAGKKVKLLMFGSNHHTPWDGTPFNYDGGFDKTVARGAVPVFDVDSGTALLTDVAAGKYDAATTAYFKQVAAWGKPLVWRWCCEMNGTWYGYGAQARANPQAFVDAWRHLHDLAVQAGATNMAWHWCPNVDPEHIQTPLAKLWPGDAYVDWSGMTGYNHGNESVAWLFNQTYDDIAALTVKPMMIGETGSVDKYGPIPGTANPSKAQWTADFAAWLPSRPLVKAFCWFNWHITEGGTVYDWEIESSPEAQAAFRSLVGSAAVVGRA